MTLRHVLVNGWFAGQSGTGSGQYLHHMLDALPAAAPATRWTLLVPPEAVHPTWPHVTVVALTTPRLRGPLRKVYWEQVTMPRMAARLGASVLWTPYWASPFFCAVPTVVTIHDLIPLLLPEYSRGMAQRLYNALVSASARRSAAVITVSEASGRDVVENLGVAARLVHPVHHGPNQPSPAGASDAADPAGLARVRQRYRLPDRYFLYLGGFDARKNLRTLLAAYVAYLQRRGDASVRLVIAGRLPEADTTFAPDPRQIAHDLGLSAQVDFIGWVDEADKPALYAAALAFFFPSLYEGFGMPLLEAMQAGTAVVTSSQ